MTRLQNKIVKLLKEDARYTAERIATMLNVSEAEVSENISALENKGVIVKYAAVINSERAGEDYGDALIEVRVTPQPRSGFDAIARKIYAFEDVKAVYLMSGTYDLAITLECKSIKDVSLFVSEKLSTIGDVVGTSTHFIMKKYKEGGVVLDSDEHREKRRLPVSE